MYLVDTNVLSAGAPTKAVPAADLIAWMDRNSARLRLSVVTVAEIEDGIAKSRREGATRKAERLSVVTVAEIEDGIAKSRREGATRKAERLSAWLETLLHLYGAQVLPIDLQIARQIGRLADAARGRGHAPGLADLAVAATAQCHGWTVLTRNVRHFAPLGVPAHDPFEALPADAA